MFGDLPYPNIDRDIENRQENLEMEQALEDKLESLQREYALKKRKLKKLQRAATAKAHVKMKLKEQECLVSKTETLQERDENVSIVSHESSPSDHHTVADNPKENSMTPFKDNNSADQPLNNSTVGDMQFVNITKVELAKLEGTVQTNTVTRTSAINTVSQSPASSCKVFMPNLDADFCDKRTHTSENPAIIHSKSCEKIAKYQNRKIVTKMKDSKPSGCTIKQGLVKNVMGKTYCESNKTTMTQSQMTDTINGNVASTKSTSSVECEIDAMIFIRNPNILECVKRESSVSDLGECNQQAQDNVKNLDLQVDIPTSEPVLGVSHTEHSEEFNTVSLNCNAVEKLKSSISAVKLEETGSGTDISQSSSVNSEDIFENGSSEENSLKRRPRKAKRRSTGAGRQRQSPRVATSSIARNDLGSTASLFLDKVPRTVNKQVIISSMFQCLVDEGKRKKANDFTIPSELLTMHIQNPENDSNSIKPLTDQMSELVSDQIVLKDSGVKTSIIPALTSSNLTRELDAEVETVYKGLVADKLMGSEFQENSVGKTEEDFDNYGNRSPTLFDSQPVVIDVREAKEPEKSQATADVDDTWAVNLLTDSEEILRINKAECNNFHDRVKSETPLEEPESTKDDDDIEQVCFEQHTCFQVPQADQLLLMESVTAVRCGQPVECVACLCTTALKLYSCVGEDWNCVATEAHSSVIRKSAVACLYGWSGQPDVNLVLRLSRSDCSTLTHYTYTNSCIKQSQVDSVTSKWVSTCPLTDHQLVLSRWSNQKTKLTKYTLDISTGQWSQFDLETCDNKIVTMATFKQIDMAVAGFTSQGVLHIWNHCCGFLLSTVDLSDVCPRDFICPQILQEQGYLFLPLLSRRKCTEAGTIIVVNPHLNTSEALTSIQAGNQTWTGCSRALMLGGYLLVTRETSGRLCVLDILSGSCLATIDDIKFTCVTSSADTFYVAHKQCVHIYSLNR